MADEGISREIQVVAFCLEDEEFAIDIQQLREVLKYTDITPLPQTSQFIEGVINLRGEVIPVIDLRKRFGLDSGEQDSHTRIIIVEIREDLIGLIVDQVSEVLHLTGEQIEPPPSSVSGCIIDFIQGIGKIAERLIIILKPEKIISSQERVPLDQIIIEDIKKQVVTQQV
ncbi:chemotaxis protein CheW [Candidatus Contubernalis alkaliaceticus]|uniref:chemotaxis protein CheW n=1 Tax=Candidatus Contubernalis alkaliaceticus TaxID=338645 RepID=UPI001F4BFB09|nr:chemotaxis protein CheW [Candidatus Contubernalis alkalaceticus]UNC91775.1 chemotaxis protein CheW [Candidatus Contubernalis alkalaceticus]